MLIAQMKKALGSLDRVERIVKLGAFVASDPRFHRSAQGRQRRLRADGEGVRRGRAPCPQRGRRAGPAAGRRGRGRCDCRRQGSAELRQLIGASPFAHRGLHGGGRIENSRAAFAAAIEAGHGIELDVQASARRRGDGLPRRGARPADRASRALVPRPRRGRSGADHARGDRTRRSRRWPRSWR